MSDHFLLVRFGLAVFLQARVMCVLTGPRPGVPDVRLSYCWWCRFLLCFIFIKIIFFIFKIGQPLSGVCAFPFVVHKWLVGWHWISGSLVVTVVAQIDYCPDHCVLTLSFLPHVTSGVSVRKHVSSLLPLRSDFIFKYPLFLRLLKLSSFYLGGILVKLFHFPLWIHCYHRTLYYHG